MNIEHPARGQWVCKAKGMWTGVRFTVVKPDCGWSGQMTPDTEVTAYSDHEVNPSGSGMVYQGKFSEFLKLFKREGDDNE